MGDKQRPQHFQLQVKTDLNELSSVIEWFEQCTKPLLAESLLWQCQVAITEGFTNTVRHAHQHLPSSTIIDLEISFFRDYLEMKIWDFGPPFDLKAKLQNISSDSAQSWQEEQGRGLYYIFKLMDQVDYIRTSNGDRNCLIMQKNLT